jgi:hypothetical protein
MKLQANKKEENGFKTLNSKGNARLFARGDGETQLYFQHHP